MRPQEVRLLVAYDVADDLRRTRLSSVLQSYGDRIQYSVFLIDVTAAQKVRLCRDVAGVIDGQEDSVLICSLGDSRDSAIRRLQYLGLQRRTSEDFGFVL